jgi:hypothetical protein
VTEVILIQGCSGGRRMEPLEGDRFYVAVLPGVPASVIDAERARLLAMPEVKAIRTSTAHAEMVGGRWRLVEEAPQLLTVPNEEDHAP